MQSKLTVFVAAFAGLLAPALPALQAANDSGSLYAIDKDGRPGTPCPLKRTEVKAEISGFLSRVTVTQIFENPLREAIEAVYTFPLGQRSAVDSMTMRIGERVIQGKIKPREEAQAIYEAARNSGRTASLLEQERPNIFTQSVANIRPGESVRITISYVETLRYEAGNYQFVFPMVVGPRYIPGTPTGKQAGGWAPDTTHVPDASRITPQVTPEGTRAGHDITMEVALDAGVPIDNVKCTSHDVAIDRPDARRAVIRLRDHATIPNKDFLLTYDVAGRKMEDAVLTHRGSRGGFFTLMLQPPERVTPAEVTPKELVFVVDTSGSMFGFPLDKSKEVMRMALANMNPRDTFNLITFAGDTHILFPQPVPATAENVERARQFMEGRRGGGGTEMMKAIRASLEPTVSQQHVRVVAFLTDGYVGNDMEIIAEVKKYSNARVFAFGIGSSVNRFLLDKMAEAGRGEVEYVSLKDDGSAAARRFFERMRDPLLTDIQVEWNGLPVSDVYPQRIPDLFAAKPLEIHGRYNAPARGVVRIRGKSAGREFVRTINVDLPAAEPRHDVLASLWARTRIDELMGRDYAGIQRGTFPVDLRNQVTQLGLDYRLMTQFTAFVAVEEKTVTEGGKPRRVEVPVEMPEGVSYQGVFGEPRAPQPAMAAQVMHKSAGGLGYGIRGIMPGTAMPKLHEEAASRDAAVQPANPQYKLHPDVWKLISGKPAKAEVKIYLHALNATALDELRKLGVEILRQDATGKFVVARIPTNQLEAAAKLSAVRYIAPNQ